jgi:hypothetical protein
MDTVGEKLLQHIFLEYKYILVIMILVAFKAVSFILFLTFGLTLFITENTRSTTALLIGEGKAFLKQRLTIL